MEENEDGRSVMAILFNLPWYFIRNCIFGLETIADTSMNAFSYELFVNFRVCFH